METVTEPQAVVVNHLPPHKKAPIKRSVISLGRRYDQPGQSYQPDAVSAYSTKLIVTTDKARYFIRPGIYGGRRHLLEGLAVIVNVDRVLQPEFDERMHYDRLRKQLGVLTVGARFNWTIYMDNEVVNSFVLCDTGDMLTPFEEDEPELPPFDPTFQDLDQELKAAGAAVSAWALATKYLDRDSQRLRGM